MTLPETDALCRRTYTLHGMPVRLGWDDPVVGQEILPLFEYYGCVPAHTDLLTPQVTFTFLTHACALSIPRGARKLAAHNSLTAWQADHQLLLSDGASTVQLDPAAATGVGTLHPSLWDKPMTVRKELVLFCFLSLLRACGLYAVHAAAVAKDGVGCLFVAASGSGKSTLTLGLVQQGWEYLTDESLLLRLHGADVVAFPLRRDLYLDSQTAQTFPDVGTHWRACPFADAQKQRLNVRALYPAQAVLTCQPRVLIFPHIVPASESRLVPVGKAAALRHLIHQSALVLLAPESIPAHLEVLTRVINQARSYQLLAGRDVARDPALMDRLLADILDPMEA